jgi:hypothetical protein
VKEREGSTRLNRKARSELEVELETKKRLDLDGEPDR